MRYEWTNERRGVFQYELCSAAGKLLLGSADGSESEQIWTPSLESSGQSKQASKQASKRQQQQQQDASHEYPELLVLVPFGAALPKPAYDEVLPRAYSMPPSGGTLVLAH